MIELNITLKMTEKEFQTLTETTDEMVMLETLGAIFEEGRYTPRMKSTSERLTTCYTLTYETAGGLYTHDMLHAESTAECYARAISRGYVSPRVHTLSQVREIAAKSYEELDRRESYLKYVYTE